MESIKDNKLDLILKSLDSLGEELAESVKVSKSDLVKAIRQTEMRNFKQLEALQWLINFTNLNHPLPNLRGWAASPDMLLSLHQNILKKKPKIILEFGSGASTLVIGDALSQNGFGKLISIESSQYYGGLTRDFVEEEGLSEYVGIRIDELKPWGGKHLNVNKYEKPFWYSLELLQDVDAVDLVLVDGPPASTCEFSRYPAMPAVFDKLSLNSEIWLDDTVRKEEKVICEKWKEEFGCTLQYLNMEKGLGIMKF